MYRFEAREDGSVMNNTRAELDLLLKSGYKLIHFCSPEELRAREELVRLAEGGNGQRARDCFVWKMTEGFRTADRKEAPGAKDTDKPDKALQWIIEREEKQCNPALYVLKDFHPLLSPRSGSAMIIRKLKDTAHALETTLSSIVLLSAQLDIPAELEKNIVIVDFALPTAEELKDRFVQMIDEYRDGIAVNLIDPGKGYVTEADAVLALAKAAQGLTMAEAELALGKAITDDKCLDLSDIQAIADEKKQIVRKTGILSIEEPVDINQVGGLEQLRHWLQRRQDIFSEDARRYGLMPPRGVLLTGVPGCGKSLCAKAIAKFWGLTLLRLDMGAVYGSLVGQSEANMRRAIQCAQAMAPCVLMIDEIEKGLSGASGGSGDGGTGSRVFGTLLSWMNDKTSPVFVVATANQFERLPPEMLRKGRFDEIFFVDFPHAKERTEIFNIHVRKAIKRKEPPLVGAAADDFIASFGFDKSHEVRRSTKFGGTETALGTLVELSRDFTGSEIEVAVQTAMIDAFADGHREFAAADVARALAATVPLIDTMSDKIESIRERARACTVSASKYEDNDQDTTMAHGEGSHDPKDTSQATPRATRGGRRIDL
jgi:SpoVK/Ycf46/Vps4 family AAA+-type ATPase